MGVDWGVGRYESTAEQLAPASREVVELAEVRSGERVLDVGTGTGNAALLAASRGAQVTAVDPAARLLDVAQARARDAGYDIAFLPGEAAALPLPDGAFDVVLSVFAAIFAPDPAAALAEMARVLAPEGRLLLSAWVPGGAVSRMNQTAGEAVAAAVGAPPGPPPFAWHETDAVTALAGPLGLTVARAERTIAFTAASPQAYVEAELERHPMALMSRQVLAQHGVDDAPLLARLVEVLSEGNEDPAAFRATSSYVIWTLRR